MNAMAQTVGEIKDGIKELVGIAPKPDTIEWLEARVVALKAQRVGVQYGGPDDHRIGAELQQVEARLKPLRAEAAATRKLHAIPKPEPEDERVIKAAKAVALSVEGRDGMARTLSAQRALLAQLEQEGAGEDRRAKVITGIAVGESSLRVAEHRVREAEDALRAARSTVATEKHTALLRECASKAGAVLAAARPLLEAVEAYEAARDAAQRKGITLPASPRTLSRAGFVDFAEQVKGFTPEAVA